MVFGIEWVGYLLLFSMMVFILILFIFIMYYLFLFKVVKDSDYWVKFVKSGCEIKFFIDVEFVIYYVDYDLCLLLFDVFVC